MSWMEGSLPVYVPVAGSALEAVVLPGSAIVGTPVTEWLAGSADDGSTSVCIDYEGNKFDTPAMKRFANRCLHAAGRHVKHFPTVARMFVPRDELLNVGYFDGERVTVGDSEKLEAWIGEYADDELVIER